jgi:hypothetical protein
MATASTSDAVVYSRPVAWLEFGIALAASLVVLKGLSPANIVTDAPPIGTDSTGHLVGVWLDRTSPGLLLPGGWSPVMFAGYPANQLYPPLANAIAGLIAFALPLATSLKIATALPLVAMPIAVWASARWAALPVGLPAALAVAIVPMVYDTSCTICGGNNGSTVNGENAFAFGLLFGILALGAFTRLLQRGTVPALVILLLGLAAWAHPVTALWTFGCALLLIAFYWRTWWPTHKRQVVGAFTGATLLSLVWWIPFIARRQWMPSLQFPKRTDYLYWLLPANTWWEIALLAAASLGLFTAIRHRWWFLVAIGISAVAAALLFIAIPNGSQLFNLRVLPFWYLGRWLLVGTGIYAIGELVLLRLERRSAGSYLFPSAAMLITSALVIGTTWGWWAVATPAGKSTPGRSSVLGVEIVDQSTGAEYAFGGHTTTAQRQQIDDVAAMLKRAGASAGCGRLAWDLGKSAEEATNLLGDNEIFWQSPVWTDGCIEGITGVYADSSATTPAAYALESLISQGVGVDFPGITQFQANLDLGVQRMGTLGVKYYLTFDDAQTTAARTQKGLHEVDHTGRWTLFEVRNSATVSDVTNKPIVIEPPQTTSEWTTLTMNYGASSFYDSVPLVQSGPADWPRLEPNVEPTPKQIPPAGVSNISQTDNSISFDVATVGRPVIVRVSAFPGWKVEGAPEIYRASPNFMVVVPTSKHVTLTHGRDAIDYIAMACGVGGIALAIWLGISTRRSRPSKAPSTS